MAEYIDRDAVLAILSDKNAAWDGYAKVKAIPAADVIERKHGKWNWVGFNIECSECGAMPNFDSTEPLYNFCPNCGADMREDESEE